MDVRTVDRSWTMKKFVEYRFGLLKHFLNQHEASPPPNAVDATAKKSRQCLQHEAKGWTHKSVFIYLPAFGLGGHVYVNCSKLSSFVRMKTRNTWRSSRLPRPGWTWLRAPSANGIWQRGMHKCQLADTESTTKLQLGKKTQQTYLYK